MRKAVPGFGAAISEAEFDRAFLPLAATPGLSLAAVSGGPDSTTLMQALAGWAARRGADPPIVATVDHGLRTGSHAEAQAVASAARGLGLEHHTLAWADAPPSGRASQAAARDARYRLLAGLASERGAVAVVTAHTLDDQAETILMRMAGGSGPAGLAGMRPVAERRGLRLVRPFLGFTKARLVATCEAAGWNVSDDPSNHDERFARVRWRRLLPALAAEGLDAETLARLAARVWRAEAALHAVAAGAYERARRPGGDLEAASVFAEPDEIGLRVLARAIEAGRGPERGPIRLARLEACHRALARAHGDAKPLRRTLAGRLLALDRSGVLTVEPEAPRRRGATARSTSLTPFVAGLPPSLGMTQSGA